MAEADKVKRQDDKRFTDVGNEPDKPLPPLQKFTSQPVPLLRDATKPAEKFVENLDAYVTLSLEKCNNPKDGLTQIESAAIYLYTLQWPKGKHSFYTMFNRALRDENRLKLIPYHDFLHLFMTALGKLPSIKDRVWRGVNGNIIAQYKPNSVHVWWGASSCSDMIEVTDDFLDKDDDRTLFSIKCYEGKIIKNHSAFPKESEVVLPPGTCVKVKSVSNPAPKLHIIDLEQIPYDESQLKICSASTSTVVGSTLYLTWLDESVNKSKENIEVQKQLRELNTSFMSFEKVNECEKFIQHNTSSSRIILIVGGKMGRQFVPKIHDLTHLMSIFVFCMDKVGNEKWAKNYEKIKAVVVHQKGLLEEVKREVDDQIKQEEFKKANTASSTEATGASNIQSIDSTDGTRLLKPIEGPEISPLEGYQKWRLLSLTEAVGPVMGLCPRLENFVWVALKNAGSDIADGLTRDESAAIHLYTMDDGYWDPSVANVLNSTLRNKDRYKMAPWFGYLKLFLTALYKLPCYQGIVWRAVREDVSKNFSQGDTVTWWTFSSTMTAVDNLKSICSSGLYTFFSIQCFDGRNIKNHSYFSGEDEILLLPGSQFKVLGIMNAKAGLTIIQLEQIRPAFPLCPPPF